MSPDGDTDLKNNRQTYILISGIICRGSGTVMANCRYLTLCKNSGCASYSLEIYTLGDKAEKQNRIGRNENFEALIWIHDVRKMKEIFY
jgi:hypothetical protein